MAEDDSADDDSVVQSADEKGVRLITLNRPAKLNAFTSASYAALAQAVEQASADPGVAVVVLTGAGRAFSAGVDLGELRSGDTSALSAGFAAMLEQFDLFPKPLIAAVNGLAVGIGMTLLLHCDLIMIDPSARFRAPFVELGTTPEAASSWLLPRAIGYQNAAWALFSGEWMDAATAMATGFAWRQCPAGTVVDEAMTVGRQLAALPSAPMAAAKRLLRHGFRERAAETIRREFDDAGRLGP